MTADFDTSRIDLAQEDDFWLGRILVQPATRQIETNGVAQTLQPRIMQVLVALARRRGGVVSRDALTLTCWEGRAVGDDAINRCIQQIRKLGETTKAFEVETIPRVGYRLHKIGGAETSDAQPADVEPAPSPPTPPAAPPRWGLVLAAAGIAVFALIVAGWMTLGRGGKHVTLEPSIAVLPFANLTGDSTRDYMAHGIASDLIETLSQIDRLKVVGRGSSFSYKADADPRTVGPALNVANILSGSVSQTGDQIRISFELADAGSGRTIVSRTYTTALTTDNMAAAQRYVAEQVAGALSIAFDIRGGRQLLGAGTRSLEAYDYYLQGREGMEFATSQLQSEGLFAKAVATDPEYAAAWGLMAIAHGSRSWTRPTPAQGRAEQDAAYAMAKKAVTLDPNISTSQAVFANLSTTQHNWGDAERASLLALDLSVNEIALAQRQLILLRAGRVAEADAIYGALEQIAPHADLGAPRYIVSAAVGRLKDLRSMVESPERPQADNLRFKVNRLEALIDLGGPPNSVREALEALSQEPDRSLSEFARAVLAVFGDKEKARRVLATWYDGPGFENALKYELIPFLAAWYGDVDLVLRVWRDDLPINVVRMAQVWGPAYGPARRRPAFNILMKDIGLVDYWRAFKWTDKCRPVGTADFECG